MSYTADGISKMILKRSPGVDTAELSLDLSLSNLFWALDGVRSLEILAQDEGYEMDIIFDRANQLMNQGLVEEVVQRAPPGGQYLSQILAKELSKAVGPIADILIEDVVEETGCDLQNIKPHQMENLVRKLTREIGPKQKAEDFYQRMRSLIGQINRS